MKLLIDIDDRVYNECLKFAASEDMGILGLHLINAVARGDIIDKGGRK